MDIKQLKYFRSIVLAGTISGAAKQLFMTQPSLSQQLHLLESELEVKLIDRGNRKITLTEAGQLLNIRAGQILELLNTTAAEVRELHNGYTGTLSIGTITSFGVAILPGVIREFHAKYPNIKFQLLEDTTPKILDLLNSGLIELGITRSAFNEELYHAVELPADPMVIAMSKEWLSGQQSQYITIDELRGRPLLLHRSNEAMIIDYCHKMGFQPDIVCKGDDVRTLIVLANEGIGLAIVPKSVLGLVPSNNISYREILDEPFKIRKSVIWMKNRYLSTAAKHFINTMLLDFNVKSEDKWLE